MHARPSRLPLQSVEPVRRTAQPLDRRQSRRTIAPARRQGIAAEVSAKLAVNLVLAIAATSALVKLLPYSLSQQTELRELRTEVVTVESRTNQLRADFNRHFDPQQLKAVMQEQSSRVDPQQHQVVLIDATDAEPEAPAQQP